MATVTFTWNSPSIPNGIITGYQLKVANTDTSNGTVRNITVSPGQTDITYTIDGDGFFRAYERYTATVTASTIIGFGPIATTSGRTLPDSELLSLSFLFLLSPSLLHYNLFLFIFNSFQYSSISYKGHHYIRYNLHYITISR